MKIGQKISQWNRARLAKRRQIKAEAEHAKLRTQGFVILTPPHCTTLANDLLRYIHEMGRSGRVTTDEKDTKSSKFIYIVICPQIFKRLPRNYIAFQMEQSINSRWFDQKYFNILKNATAIADYSISNIKFLHANEIPFGKVFHLPITPQDHATEPQVEPKQRQDIVFYGDDSAPRRRAYLSAISSKYNVKILNNLFGEDLQRELSNAKIIINVHFYENALLETTRLSEALRHNAIIISEDTSDLNENPEFQEVIDFIPAGDIDCMLSRIGFWLDNEANRSSKVKINREKVKSFNNQTAFNFYRMLLALEITDYQTFYKVASKHISITEKMCLSLPECYERRASFDLENKYDFTYFPGLRHKKGWIGCGLSYKFLLQKAKDQGLLKITVCEDDVGFSSEHLQQLNEIEELLENQEWDIFSGFMADISSNAELKHIMTGKHFEYLATDQMISMVYNVYKNTVFSALDGWDENNHDDTTNTVDRFIQNKSQHKVITTYPFLAEHKEDLKSTIWGFQNTQYNDMIQRTLDKIKFKTSTKNSAESPAR
jgi:GR25 family glycosyltransferase involved in LPS biosynthesis